MKQFLLDVVAPLRRTDAERADRPMHWLLAAVIVLPIAVFATGAAISYRQHVAEAQDRLQRNLGTVYEHAVKVLETIELASRYLDQVFENVTDEQLRANEADYNRRIRTLTDTLPQFADIWIVGADGHPLASGTVFPIPRQLDLSDRDYFRAHKNNEVNGLYVGDVVTSRATNAARPAALLRAQPQAHRGGRQFRRRDRDVDLAGLFPRLLRDADPADRRGADPRGRRRARALSGGAAIRPGSRAAMPFRRHSTRTVSPACSPSYPRSTARSACSRSASCRAFPST